MSLKQCTTEHFLLTFQHFVCLFLGVNATRMYFSLKDSEQNWFNTKQLWKFENLVGKKQFTKLIIFTIVLPNMCLFMEANIYSFNSVLKTLNKIYSDLKIRTVLNNWHNKDLLTPILPIAGKCDPSFAHELLSFRLEPRCWIHSIFVCNVTL